MSVPGNPFDGKDGTRKTFRGILKILTRRLLPGKRGK